MVATAQGSALRPTATVLVASAAAFLASLDLFIVNIAFPEIRSAFGHADLAAMSWILNGYTVVFAAFLNPAGRLGDRYGHRRIFLCGLVVFTVASAACGLSGTFAILVAARVVQAVGAAMLMPSSLALLLAAVPASRRAIAVSTWSAVGAMAAALGPPVGGLLVELSWRWIFFVNVPLGLLALAAGPWVLAKSNTTGVGVPDLFGALSLMLGVGALVWALIELPTAGWTATKVVSAGVFALCAMATAVWRSLRHPSPALDLAAIRVMPMWSSCLALLIFSAAFAAMLLGSVMFLTTVWGETPAVAGLCLSPGPIVVVIVSLTVAGRLIGKVGIGAVAAVGAILYVGGIVIWLCRVGASPEYVANFLPGQILTGAGVGLVIPSLSAVTGLALPSHRWGAGSALTNTARQLGTVLGTAVLTMIYQPGIDLTTVRRGWVFVAAAAGTAALIAAVLAVRWRPDPE
ncbi:MFS transporter [Mycolicibacterium fluoranthenivorans]|uniref:MFS transporter n=1 Tax=Mycolicibacterium fluoranthenivorans TaxID=258505 RepID=A0A7G8P8B2_9MYCO|nr:MULTISPECIES: MFS transporter [Mycobacteriaceae]MCV7256262.1 MFS transporter [Mycobacterium hackensackense]QNJ90578.1 MFS transporter [Mycolicibacterium fluoranthenivorans]